MKKAFSLIELLIVIAIIGALMALTMPTLSMIKGKANSLKCLNNLRQMQLGSIAYAQNYKGKFVPMGLVVGNNAIMAFKTDWPANLEFLDLATGGMVNGDVKNYSKALACPHQKDHAAVTEYDNLLRMSYGYNVQNRDYNNIKYRGTYLGPKITDPGVADRIAFIDSIGWWLLNPDKVTCYYILSDDTYRDGRGPGVPSAGVALRHAKKANMVFGDGRAGSYGIDSVWGKFRKTFVEFDNGIWNIE